MQIHISTSDAAPIYLQIVNQVKRQIMSGGLTPGQELPPIRVLAEQLLVNPNTVARAYRELESARLVVKRRTAGTYVSDECPLLSLRERVRIVTERVDALLAESRQLEIPFGDLIELLHDRHRATQPDEIGASPWRR